MKKGAKYESHLEFGCYRISSPLHIRYNVARIVQNILYAFSFIFSHRRSSFFMGGGGGRKEVVLYFSSFERSVQVSENTLPYCTTTFSLLLFVGTENLDILYASEISADSVGQN
jgi:hypothetical protein